MHDDYDGFNFFRGLIVAVPVGIVLWVVILNALGII